MAADSVAARRAVREHLEAHFDEYLSNVATYLRQAYPDLQLSNEVSEEIAATVIVRVSHSNPEPSDIENALCKSADDVVRARRPRLSQARLLEEMNGPLRSEFPRSLPSLRLVQSFSRSPAANADGETPAAFEPGSRLLLANPPVDLGASIGFGGARTNEREPGFKSDESADESAASASAAGTEVAEAVQDDAVVESGTLREDDGIGASHVEPKLDGFEEAFFAEGEAMDTASAEGRVESPQAPTTDAPSQRGETPRDGDSNPTDAAVAEGGEQLVDWPRVDGHGADAEQASAESKQAARNAEVADTRVEHAAAEDFETFDAEHAPGEVHTRDRDDERDDPVQASHAAEHFRAEHAHSEHPPSEVSHAGDLQRPSPAQTVEHALANAERALQGLNIDEPAEGGALFDRKLSSVPPTRESLVPRAVSPDTHHQPERSAEPPARTRRKAATRSKKSAVKRRPSAKNTKTAHTKTAAKRATPKRPAAPARERQKPAPAASGSGFVADDLAVLAMLGFPSNPRRAAMLCVTAVSEELGIEAHVDLTPQVSQVVAALDDLRAKRFSPLPPDAHLQWQRVARQATLRAFFNAAK